MSRDDRLGIEEAMHKHGTVGSTVSQGVQVDSSDTALHVDWDCTNKQMESAKKKRKFFQKRSNHTSSPSFVLGQRQGRKQI